MCTFKKGCVVLKKDKVLSFIVASLPFLFGALLVAGFIAVLVSPEGQAAVVEQQAAIAEDASRFVYTDTIGDENIFVDAQTGVNYLIITVGMGAGRSCVLTPLYNADGSLIVTEVPSEADSEP